MARILKVAAIAGAIAALALLSGVEANTQLFPELRRHGSVYRNAKAHEDRHHAALGFTPNATASWFPSPIDHWDAASGTFQDRFFYDTTYWDAASGPCMMYLNGEAPLNQAVGGYMADIAKEMNACTVAIEHRWYGNSLPGALTDKALFTKTLTVEQAMADIMTLKAYFETNIAKRNVTWMLVGGSYSGAVTVWMNEVYPGAFKASWAASGVVKATLDFFEYDGHIKSVITQDCFEALRLAFLTALGAWDKGGEEREMVAAMFGVNSSAVDKTGFFDMMAYGYEGAVQYSMRTEMCNLVLPLEYQDPMAVLRRYSVAAVNFWGEAYPKSCRWNRARCDAAADPAGWTAAGNSWFWQVCSEFGWWQIGYPGGIKPINISTAYNIEQCREMFYNNTFPDVWAFNKKFNGLHPQTGGYIVATQGSDDPWSTTGLKYDVSPTFPVNTAQCADCGHCSSMMAPGYVSGNPVQLQAQQQLVMGKLQEWMARP